MKKLWQKSPQDTGLNKEIESFETKDDLLMDQKLLKYDVCGSLAHANMLHKIGILNKKELSLLEKGLKEILDLYNQGKFILGEGSEDMHTAIEDYLTKKYGQVGEKIHTGRSRNDQVLTAIRLYSKEKLSAVLEETKKITGLFADFGQKYKNIPMPGYTHMQKAMPSSVGLWAGSFADSLTDDISLLRTAYVINDQSPLGSAAGFGSPLPLDRQMTAKLMGFSKVQQNSIYCQNSRGKVEAIIIASLISLLSTLNKFASDIMLFNTSEFDFIKIHPSICTGSSIMPQKKNLDVAELIRSKIHLLLGHYVAIVSLSGNLPSGFNRDLQDSKKPLIESFEITLSTLRAVEILLNNIRPKIEVLKEAMTEELFATSKVYKLVKKGMPFRQAYRKVGARLSKLR